MDAYERNVAIDTNGPEFTSALPDVDIDLLVEAGFNRAGTGNAAGDMQTQHMLSNHLNSTPMLHPEVHFLQSGVDSHFSPRDISIGKGTQAEKDGPVPFLLDTREVAPTLDIEDDSFPRSVQNTAIEDAAVAMNEAMQPFYLSLDPVQDMLEVLPPFSDASFMTKSMWQSSTPLEAHVPEDNGDENHAMAPMIGANIHGERRAMQTTESQLLPMSVVPSSRLPPASRVFESHGMPPMHLSRPRHSLKRQNTSLGPSTRPMKAPRKKAERKKNDLPKANGLEISKQAGNAPERLSIAKGIKNGIGRRRTSSTAHLTLEERKRRRAERNRESAEKSRMRRKQMVLELETNVASLRVENRHLKTKFERYHTHLTSTSAEVRRKKEAMGNEFSEADQAMLSPLYEALSALQRCKDECPRTFRRGPNSPLIPLNIPKRT